MLALGFGVHSFVFCCTVLVRTNKAITSLRCPGIGRPHLAPALLLQPVGFWSDMSKLLYCLDSDLILRYTDEACVRRPSARLRGSREAFHSGGCTCRVPKLHKLQPGSNASSLDLQPRFAFWWNSFCHFLLASMFLVDGAHRRMLFDPCRSEGLYC